MYVLVLIIWTHVSSLQSPFWLYVVIHVYSCLFCVFLVPSLCLICVVTALCVFPINSLLCSQSPTFPKQSLFYWEATHATASKSSMTSKTISKTTLCFKLYSYKQASSVLISSSIVLSFYVQLSSALSSTYLQSCDSLCQGSVADKPLEARHGGEHHFKLWWILHTAASQRILDGHQ